MKNIMKNKILSSLKTDIPASIIVFLVALPLCLGISLASGAPAFSGIIAGIIGGMIVGSLSGSSIGVSGPAAGLAAIVFTSISLLDSYNSFLVAVVLGGLIQITFGILKVGNISSLFPSSVIKGMLSGIGVIIIMKQIPYFFGYITNQPTNDPLFTQENGNPLIYALPVMLNNMMPGSTIIGCISLAILILWDKKLRNKTGIFQVIQGPLVAVIIGILFYVLTQQSKTLSISAPNLVSVPVPNSIDGFLNQFLTPDFKQIINYDIWIIAFTIALIASLETLLCVEATDKLVPGKHVTPKNRELLAQGVGNVLSGMIGGLPVTQVIVRSSANIQSGAKTRISTILHGCLLLISVVTIPQLLNKIPLSVLAAILLIVGYKLTQPRLFKQMYHSGWKHFIPFIATVSGIILTNMLYGIAIGLIAYSCFTPFSVLSFNSTNQPWVLIKKCKILFCLIVKKVRQIV